MTERELIDRLKASFPARKAEVGIGDDAAIVRSTGRLVVTNDMLIEDVDFTASIPARFIIRKSLAANLSDLAAMGARPQWFVLALALPSSFLASFEEIVKALRQASEEHAIELIGGDLSSATKLVVSITAAGSIDEGSAPLLRSGARAGDRLYLSRPIGGAAAGLRLLQSGWRIQSDGVVTAPSSTRSIGYALREFASSAIRRQVDPEPEVKLGLALSASGLATSCIDVSDGLSTDLRHLCEASGCGAEVERERIPVFQELAASAPALGINAAEAVLHGGEEFALLFTSSQRESELSRLLGRPVYAIGRMTADRSIVLRSGDQLTPLLAGGFDHFAGEKPAR